MKTCRSCQMRRWSTWYREDLEEMLCQECYDREILQKKIDDNAVKSPKIKAGEIRADLQGEEFRVVKISNQYSEVSEYDSNGVCQDLSTDEQLAECCLDPEDVLYCAVEKQFSHTTKPYQGLMTYVFLISRDSIILGE